MLSLTKIKVGTKIVVNGEPFVVLFSQHSKTGRAGAVLRTKLKNIKTGSCVSKTFQGADKIEPAVTKTKKAQFLYSSGDRYFFMDCESYEQFDIDAAVIGESAKFLTEETEIDILYFDECPINIELPIKMEFKVTEAPPSIRGNTADGGSKQITIETGTKISTPLFIKTGDKIRINTQTGQYTERVNRL